MVQVLIACIQFMFISAVVSTETHREKRFVLNSETDIAAELIKLRAEVAGLTTLVQQNHGSVYVHWGRTTCDGNSSQLIYKGSVYSQKGNGPNQLCLPEDPTWAKYDDGSQSNDRAYIYGAEFDEIGDVIFGKHVRDQDIPCAVCKVPGVSVMIPARANCYPGWNLEYAGYLMSQYYAYTAPANYVCVDGDPEFIERGQGDTNGHLLYLVEGVCGTLVCPQYFNNRELACTVCSK